MTNHLQTNSLIAITGMMLVLAMWAGMAVTTHAVASEPTTCAMTFLALGGLGAILYRNQYNHSNIEGSKSST